MLDMTASESPGLWAMEGHVYLNGVMNVSDLPDRFERCLNEDPVLSVGRVWVEVIERLDQEGTILHVPLVLSATTEVEAEKLGGTALQKAFGSAVRAVGPSLGPFGWTLGVGNIERADQHIRIRPGSKLSAVVTAPAAPQPYDPYLPGQCSRMEPGRTAIPVSLSCDYSADLPLWGDWPPDTPLPEALRQRLAAWQEEWESNVLPGFGWQSETARAHWLSQVDGLAAELREVLAGRAEVEVGPTE